MSLLWSAEKIENLEKTLKVKDMEIVGLNMKHKEEIDALKKQWVSFIDFSLNTIFSLELLNVWALIILFISSFFFFFYKGFTDWGKVSA
jgi:hypothetical protein